MGDMMTPAGRLAYSRKAWALVWVQHGVEDFMIGTCDHPSRTLLFETRALARAHRDKKYGYIKGRDDLHAPPHVWSLPRVKRVRVTVEVCND